jgi:L-lactate dehydrogenase (cytochrome)
MCLLHSATSSRRYLRKNTISLDFKIFTMDDKNVKYLTAEEVGRHNNLSDAWLIVNNVVWDVTDFASYHPGGEDIIVKYFGSDASAIYNEFHGPGVVSEFFGEGKKIGVLGGTRTSEKSLSLQQRRFRRAKVVGDLPDLQAILNLTDFQLAAHQYLNARAWAFISGASNDNLSRDWNAEWYQNLMFRPRILNPVKNVDTSTSILGLRLDIPILNSPASSAAFVHSDAEIALAKGLAARGSAMIVPTMASYSVEEITGALTEPGKFFFQLYASEDKVITKILLDNAVRLKAKAIVVTVDLPVMSKREGYERYELAVAREKASKEPKSVGKALVSQIPARASRAVDSNLSWDDIRWIQNYTGLPVFIKGIQCVEDALLAFRAGCAGIYISNHGGRALDTVQPSILTLAEIRAAHPEILKKMVVLVDGGIRRGTDILKAICLGATAVCLGRPFFWSLLYGQEGVEHALDSEFLHYF